MPYPLAIEISAKQYALYRKRVEDKKFVSFMEKVFERDNWTCQFCAFQSKKHMTVTSLDRNFANHKFDNLATTCPLCEATLLNQGSEDDAKGMMIYLPEMSQNDLNAYMHFVFCSIINRTQYKSTALTMYKYFKFRSETLEKDFGEGSNNPHNFCELFESRENINSWQDLLDSDMGEKTKKTLQGISFLPFKDVFKDMVIDWTNEAFNTDSKTKDIAKAS